MRRCWPQHFEADQNSSTTEAELKAKMLAPLKALSLRWCQVFQAVCEVDLDGFITKANPGAIPIQKKLGGPRALPEVFCSRRRLLATSALFSG